MVKYSRSNCVWRSIDVGEVAADDVHGLHADGLILVMEQLFEQPFVSSSHHLHEGVILPYFLSEAEDCGEVVKWGRVIF